MTRTQKKIIITGLIIGAAFFVFLLLVYLPSRNTVREIKSELRGVEAQIEEIGAIIGDAESLDKGIKSLQARQKKINSKMRDAGCEMQYEDVIRVLSCILYPVSGISILTEN